MSVPTFTNFFFSHCGSEHIFCRPSSFLLCVGDFLFLAWFPFRSFRTSSTVLVVQVERQRLPNGVTTEIHTKRQHCKLVERRRLEAAVARRRKRRKRLVRRVEQKTVSIVKLSNLSLTFSDGASEGASEGGATKPRRCHHLPQKDTGGDGNLSRCTRRTRW